MPQRLISDRDKSFVNQLLDHLVSRLGISHITSTAYHPEGNAFIESFHHTLNTHFRFINQACMPFEEAFDTALYAYRATPHHSTGHSPSFLVFGKDPRLASDTDWRLETTPINHERLKFLSMIRLDVQLQAQRQSISRNAARNENRQPIEFEEHQLILCRHLPLDRLKYKVAFLLGPVQCDKVLYVLEYSILTTVDFLFNYSIRFAHRGLV